jgi:hypothetical protein
MSGYVMREDDGSVSTIAFEPRDDRIAPIYLVRVRF